ncbi:MAG: hypothetical protein R3C41_20755 [Calditrichia bacterium]
MGLFLWAIGLGKDGSVLIRVVKKYGIAGSEAKVFIQKLWSGRFLPSRRRRSNGAGMTVE